MFGLHRRLNLLSLGVVESETFTDNTDVRKTGQEMDMIRQRTIAYEYLCRLEEAKTWMEACLKEKLPAATDFEESLCNGVYLAKLGNFIAPEVLPLNKIYDIDQKRYKVSTFQFCTLTDIKVVFLNTK